MDGKKCAECKELEEQFSADLEDYNEAMLELDDLKEKVVISDAFLKLHKKECKMNRVEENDRALGIGE